MISTPFETELYRLLTTFFDRHDYILLADRKQFRKTTPSGFQNVILTPTVYTDETWLDVNFGCRNQQVEQIAQQFLNNLPGYRNDANTLILSIGKYNDIRHFRYRIQSQEDLEETCFQIESFFEQTGFPFMDESVRLAAIDRLLNDTPTQPCKFLYNQTHRFFKGIIAARLNDNAYFGGLADCYRYLLPKNGNSTVEIINFERLLEYLVYYSAN